MKEDLSLARPTHSVDDCLLIRQQSPAEGLGKASSISGIYNNFSVETGLTYSTYGLNQRAISHHCGLAPKQI